MVNNVHQSISSKQHNIRNHIISHVSYVAVIDKKTFRMCLNQGVYIEMIVDHRNSVLVITCTVAHAQHVIRVQRCIFTQVVKSG